MKNIDYMSSEVMMKAINEAVDYIQTRTIKKPEIVIVLGSGLGDFAKHISNADVIDYKDIPNFPTPTVAGHGGKLYIGELSGKCVAIMQGRNHYYEGYDTQTITLPVRILRKLGAKSIILTNACGGVSKHFRPGDLMVIEDHLGNFCPSPLRGAYLEEFGPRFVDMSKPYDLAYIDLAIKKADELGFRLQKGVYGFWQGPTYESPAEIRAYMALGADVVGMSTVPETIIANSCGMRVLGISTITNMTCILSKGETNHEEVVEMGLKVAGRFTELLKEVIKEM